MAAFNSAATLYRRTGDEYDNLSRYPCVGVNHALVLDHRGDDIGRVFLFLHGKRYGRPLSRKENWRGYNQQRAERHP